MSFPLIHALSLDKGLIKAVLESPKRKKSLSHAVKVVIVKQLEAGGSLEHTLETVKRLLQFLLVALYELEERIRTPNGYCDSFCTSLPYDILAILTK